MTAQTLYKLTTADGWTRAGMSNACLWGEGVTHAGTGRGDLCGPGYIHAYTDPLLALLFNPIHAALDRPMLWEARGVVAKDDRGIKVGCVSLTTIRRLPVPVVTMEQRIHFGILCALAVRHSQGFADWAQRWLSGLDRRGEAARAAEAAWWAAGEAARAAEAKPIDLIALAHRAVAAPAEPGGLGHGPHDG